MSATPRLSTVSNERPVDALEPGATQAVRLYDRLLALSGSSVTDAEFNQQFLRALADETNAAGAIFVSSTPSGADIHSKLVSRQALAWAPTMEAQLCQALPEIGSSGGVISLCEHPKLVACASGIVKTTPGGRSSEPVGWLVLILVLGELPVEAFYLILQVAGGFYNLRDGWREQALMSETMAWDRKLKDCALEAAKCETRALAERSLAENLRQLLGADSVILASSSDTQSEPKLLCMTGVQALSQGAELKHEANAAFQEARIADAQPPFSSTAAPALAIDTGTSVNTASGTPPVAPPRKAPSPSRGNAQERLRRTLGVEALHVVGTELATGLLIAIGGRELSASRRAALSRQTPLFAISLAAAEGKRVRRQRSSTRLWVAGVVLALAASLFIPIDHHISGDVVVEPEQRRLVAAPFDGVVESSQVKAGDIVAKGALLATLDGRELELELSRLGAERDRLSQEFSLSLARGEAAQAEISRLQQTAFDKRITLVRQQIAALEIRAPIDGVVLGGELDRAEGIPVRKGDRLIEIGKSNRLRAAVAVLDDDIGAFGADAPVYLWFPSAGGERIESVIERIRPRAEIRDGRNVFIAEVSLTGQLTNSLRAGANGKAEIAAGNRALGWVLFHRPWRLVRRWLVI